MARSLRSFQGIGGSAGERERKGASPIPLSIFSSSSQLSLLCRSHHRSRILRDEVKNRKKSFIFLFLKLPILLAFFIRSGERKDF